MVRRLDEIMHEKCLVQGLAHLKHQWMLSIIGYYNKVLITLTLRSLIEFNNLLVANHDPSLSIEKL